MLVERVVERAMVVDEYLPVLDGVSDGDYVALWHIEGHTPGDAPSC